jgi:hypothetical protein
MSFQPRLVSSNDSNTPPRSEDRARFDGPPPRARPGDRLEPWPASVTARAPLAEAATREGINPDLAAILIVERTLLDEDFTRRGLDGLVPALDTRARSTVVEVVLSEAQRAYLRAICKQRIVQLQDGTRHLLAIPMRLTERITADTLDEHLRCELLPSAILWERAAVATGRTMSEWAAFAAHDLR